MTTLLASYSSSVSAIPLLQWVHGGRSIRTNVKSQVGCFCSQKPSGKSEISDVEFVNCRVYLRFDKPFTYWFRFGAVRRELGQVPRMSARQLRAEDVERGEHAFSCLISADGFRGFDSLLNSFETTFMIAQAQGGPFLCDFCR